MRTKVSEQAIVIPKQWLEGVDEGVDEVEIRREHNLILIEPVSETDPVLALGTQPIEIDVDDASVNHDYYLTQP